MTMTDQKKIEAQGDSEVFSCAQCEAAISDAVDNQDNLADMEITGSAGIRQAMEQHLAGCAACSRLLGEARRGLAWLNILKAERPEPPATLALRIISQTSGSQLGGLTPAVAGGQLLPIQPRAYRFFGFAELRNALYQPRLAMTAAMAFFSISLTLSLTGIRLSAIHLADLKPSNLRQQFYQTDARVIRYYDNLPVVAEVESRMQEMQQTPGVDAVPSSSPASSNPNINQNDQKQPSPNGSSRREMPIHSVRERIKA
jgi:hypothetical protein